VPVQRQVQRCTSPTNQRYTDEELLFLLDIVEDILPIGPAQWDVVTWKFCKKFPRNGHTVISFCRKFNDLKSMKIPTGDPNMPETVFRAKVIAEKIMDNCTAAVMVERAPEDEDAENEDNDCDEVVFVALIIQKRIMTLKLQKQKKTNPAFHLPVSRTNSRAERKQAYFDHFEEFIMEEHCYDREQEECHEKEECREKEERREMEERHYNSKKKNKRYKHETHGMDRIFDKNDKNTIQAILRLIVAMNAQLIRLTNFMEDGFPRFANNAPVARMPTRHKDTTDRSYDTSDDTIYSENDHHDGKCKLQK